MPAAKNKKALNQKNASRNTGKASGRPSKPVAEARKAPAGRSLAARTFKREVWGFILMFLALFALL